MRACVRAHSAPSVVYADCSVFVGSKAMLVRKVSRHGRDEVGRRLSGCGSIDMLKVSMLVERGGWDRGRERKQLFDSNVIGKITFECVHACAFGGHVENSGAWDKHATNKT